MFESCVTYEAGIAEPIDFPPTDCPVWILGKQYSAKYDLDELRADIRSKIWLTYRKNFPPIGGNGPTSDGGWGCMLRCGQMVAAQALLRRHLGKNWQWEPQCTDQTYLRILKMFEDRKNAIYSIHQIAQMGESEGKVVGQWFGPNTVAQVLKKLSVYDDWSSLAVFVAMDNTVIIDEIKLECRTVNKTPKYIADVKNGDVHADDDQFGKEDQNETNGFVDEGLSKSTTNVDRDGASSTWRPLLLFVPLRLGLSDINPIYFTGLKKCFTFKQSLGLIGGRPNHACYFIGYVGNELVYLDPHTTQLAVCLDCADPACTRDSEESYHCSAASRMDFIQLDPSVAMCFYCETEEDFDDLCEQIQRSIVEEESTPLFEICKERKWLGLDNFGIKVSDYNGGMNEFAVVETERNFDTSDEEYELL